MAYSIVPPDTHSLQIQLTQGRFAIVDAEDYERIAKYKWYANIQKNTAYALSDTRHNGERTCFRMHRLVINAAPGKVVDHINGNGLDNRKANLRECEQRQNLWNITSRTGTSKYKGVSWDISRSIWQATIRYDNVQYNLGRYVDEYDAAAAYNKAALKFFGEFAKVNLLP